MSYWDKSSRDRPQKIMTPIAVMTNTISNAAGAKILICFIASPLPHLIHRRHSIDSNRHLTLAGQDEVPMNRA